MFFHRVTPLLLLLGCFGFSDNIPSTGSATQPSSEEQANLDQLSGKLNGVLVWSTSRINPRHDLWIMSADGKGAKALTQGDPVDWFPRISPDGKWVLFNRSNAGWVPETDADQPDKWDLWIIGIDGQGERKILDKATWGTWRPNGTEIVFSRAGKVFLMNLESKKETLLLDGTTVWDKNVILQEPNMSPDGLFLAITLRGSQRETGIWDLTKKSWQVSGEGCQIDWVPGGKAIYRVNSTGNGGSAAPSEILQFPFENGKQVGKVGFFGVPKEHRLMDLPGRRSHEYFPRLDNTGKWMAWGATDRGHDHDIYDYEIYLWQLGTPVTKAIRMTYHSGNDRWPDLWLAK